MQPLLMASASTFRRQRDALPWVYVAHEGHQDSPLKLPTSPTIPRVILWTRAGNKVCLLSSYHLEGPRHHGRYIIKSLGLEHSYHEPYFTDGETEARSIMQLDRKHDSVNGLLMLTPERGRGLDLSTGTG